MDIIKARRLLLKIQAFLEHDTQPDLSRLEKDLIKSYILQLYEAVQEEEVHKTEQVSRGYDMPAKPKVETPKFEPPVVQVKEEVIETPKVTIPEIKPQRQVEIPVEINYPEPEVIATPPKVEYKYEPKVEPVIEQKVEPKIFVPVHEPVKEKIQEPVWKPETHHSGGDEALQKLFDQQKSEDMPERFSHVPIASIESAMGLNERIFTLKELFGGDRDLFDATCNQLNNLNSFAEARTLLMNGPAKKYHWGDSERLKMAEQFIRIVSRRYPKHG